MRKIAAERAQPVLIFLLALAGHVEFPQYCRNTILLASKLEFV